MTGILEILAQRIPDLPPKMASAARFSLDNPDYIALNSMRSAATKCGVTSPTMLRLARLLDFDSYTDFKNAFQQSVIADGFKDRAKKLTKNEISDGQKSILQSITESAVMNLEKTLTGSNPDDLTTMARLLLSARTPYVIGLGSLHSVATFMQVTGRMTLPGLRVPRLGEYTLIETLGAIGSEDVVLVLSVSPYAKGTADALRFAKERNATIMVITDRRSSPLLEFADYYFLTATSSLHYYPSFISTVAVIEALLATVVAEGGDEVLNRIAKIESIREKSGAYLK